MQPIQVKLNPNRQMPQRAKTTGQYPIRGKNRIKSARQNRRRKYWKQRPRTRGKWKGPLDKAQPEEACRKEQGRKNKSGKSTFHECIKLEACAVFKIRRKPNTVFL